MKVNQKWMFFLIFCSLVFFCMFNFFFKETKSLDDKIDVETQRKALIATAEAYFRQGEQLQYDSFRKNFYATPEDATKQHYVYTVCSAITFQVYYQTFGIKIPDDTELLLDYAAKYKDNKSVVLRYYGSEDEIYNDDVIGTKGNPNYENLFNEWIDILKPGDLFVYTGHVMLVHSIDKENGVVNLLDAINGDRYDYENTREDVYEPSGTISKEDYLADGVQYVNNLKQKLYVRYYNMNTKNIKVSRMAIVRIINKDMTYIDSKDGVTKDYKIKTSALSRLKYPEIDIEKTIEVSNGKEIVSENILTNIGENITYEITIKNNSDSNYSSFEVVENIDEDLVLVDNGDGILINNQLKWSISSLNTGENIKLRYTVKVPNDKTLLGKVIVSTGRVDNIATSKIETLIGNKLSNEEKKKLNSTVLSLKSNSLIERQFIDQVYEDAFGLKLGLSNLSNLDIISYTNSGDDVLYVKRTKINDTSASKYIYRNFYGLRAFKGVEPGQNNNDRNCGNSNLVRIHTMWNLYATSEINDKIRDISSDILLDGDIILLGVGKEKKIENEVCPVIEDWKETSYMFLNDKLIRKVAANQFEEISGEELTIFLRNIVAENFIVLRPSIAMVNQQSSDDGNDSSTSVCYKNKTSGSCTWTSSVPGGTDYDVVNVSQGNCFGVCSEAKEATLIFKNDDTTVKSSNCTIPENKNVCIESITAPGLQSKDGYTHTGWGNEGCTIATYGVSHSFGSVSTSHTYYACFKKNEDIEKEEQKPDIFDKTKCTYSSLTTVTRDKNYLNCKYTNVGYGDASASDNAAGNIKACCEAKGYTWVSGNFSGGYEYCITDCKSNSDSENVENGGSDNSNGDTIEPDDTPSGGIVIPDDDSGENVDDNPQTESVAIFLAWIVGLGTLLYSFWYFKNTRNRLFVK